MKLKFLMPLLVAMIASCTSIKEHNAQIEQPIAATDLKSDVDYIYDRLQKMHPRLYWYISKEKLDYKFDSVKKTIVQPMKSFDFFNKIAPIIKTIGQGHMGVYPPGKKYSKTELKALIKKGVGPFSQFEFELFDGKVFVVKNKSYYKKIKIGTELLAVNGEKVSDIIAKYKKTFASDGLNTNFIDQKTAKNFSNYFVYEHGAKDSVQYQFKKNDSIQNILIKRGIVDSVKLDANKKPIKPIVDKAKAKAIKERNNIFGFNKERKLYNRNLRFIGQDSVVAYMKINGFTIGDYEKFYKNSFSRIKTLNAKTLIIDLRDNGGGRLAEIANLYAYLATEPYIFADKSEVVSRTSVIANMDYFKGKSWYWQPFLVAIAPVVYPLYYFKISKGSDGKFYQSSSETKSKKPKADNFKGKIYVLINGNSFSASSILSSNLKGSKRAFFVGDETGGAFNGTVAGQMPRVELPKSKIAVRVGLLAIIPFYKTTTVGRGIFPDKEIKPTLQDRIDNKDPELEWVLNDIKSK